MDDYETYMNKSFINPFLVSVAFEIRFPSSISLLKDIDKYQQKITKNFPKYEKSFKMSKLPIPHDLTLEMHNFFNIDRKDEIRVKHDSIALISKEYKNIDNFTEKCKQVFNDFFKIYNITNSTRIGLRYVNNYPTMEEDPGKVLKHISDNFVPFIDESILNSYSIRGKKIELLISEENIETMLRIMLRKHKSENYFVYILDFDSFINYQLELTNYLEILTKLREVGKKYFLKSITKKYFNKMTDLKLKGD